MLWSRILVAFALSASLHAAVLPDGFDVYRKGQSSPAVLADKPVWDEYGLKDAEQATYAGAGRTFTVSAHHFQDPTGAAAAFDWQKPEQAKASRVANLAATFPGGELIVFGNYLLRIEGWQPSASDVAPLVKALPSVSRASLPILRGYMPEHNKIGNSDRYILGPGTLRQFEPRIPEEAAAFHLSSEAATARYRTSNGDVQLTLFMFPTPQIARVQLPNFEKIPGAEVKRSGPLLAITLPVSAAAAPGNFSEVAKALLAKIDYRPEFMWTENVPRNENPGKMIMAIVDLAGFLISLCAVGGLLMAGLRIFGPRFGISIAGGPIQELDLREK
jgi:hypothetical protein